ncbi:MULTISPECIES: polysaccharide biosynthesis/export family protein [unclassified Prevotella]|uniref:polysaccharide biosynthesis/export family protein n=1 Tax=unclassified Prevotella TaxID=2638335 RepID=UPI00048CD30B|nr:MULTISPECIES: polysaccharide biosynthesis/export family protein [unclassified Prevotella]
MKKFYYLFVVLAVATIMSSCGSTKNVAYFKNSDSIDFSQSRRLYDAKIMPKDQLTITVNTTDPEVSSAFNLIMQNAYTQGRNLNSGGGGTVMPYLVDNEGYIKFPIIGALKVVGLTKRQCERMIEDKIRPYLSENENPVVTVQMSSYSISVLGEVARPGTFMVSREEITILEALAQAGDLTIYGVRDKVKLIRKNADGKKEMHTLNLNDANIVNSPYYYLQQNDVVYVEPNKVKAQNSSVGSMTTLWFSATSILISLTSLLYNILK